MKIINKKVIVEEMKIDFRIDICSTYKRECPDKKIFGILEEVTLAFQVNVTNW
jgi:hypothetical protein